MVLKCRVVCCSLRRAVVDWVRRAMLDILGLKFSGSQAKIRGSLESYRENGIQCCSTERITCRRAFLGGGRNDGTAGGFARGKLPSGDGSGPRRASARLPAAFPLSLSLSLSPSAHNPSRKSRVHSPTPSPSSPPFRYPLSRQTCQRNNAPVRS